MGCTSFALLKKRQKEEQKQEELKQEEQKQEELKQEEQKQGLIDNAIKENISVPPKTIADPELGEFDDNFTWSAMVLAAQGKNKSNIDR